MKAGDQLLGLQWSRQRFPALLCLLCTLQDIETQIARPHPQSYIRAGIQELTLFFLIN